MQLTIEVSEELMEKAVDSAELRFMAQRVMGGGDLGVEPLSRLALLVLQAYETQKPKRKKHGKIEL